MGRPPGLFRSPLPVGPVPPSGWVQSLCWGGAYSSAAGAASGVHPSTTILRSCGGGGPLFIVKVLMGRPFTSSPGNRLQYFRRESGLVEHQRRVEVPVQAV